MEIGQVIGGRYLLQRLTQQGQYATVYQGIDQSFQRLVAVKVVSAAYIPQYRAAVRKTSLFSHPNIVMLYDMVIEAERLYLVEEYVEGDDFAALLQAQLQPQNVADYGRQICAALIYASSPGQRVCHGDVTPTALLRDRRGLIRVNDFALPSDIQYFSAWSSVGGEGTPLADRDLPWGVMSTGRQADDTRAVGLLLYQLLAGRAPHATTVEPPIDGQLRFLRNVPRDLCELVARTIIRNHPQHITTVEVLHEELYTLTETLEPSSPFAANGVAFQPAEEVQPRPLYPSMLPTGNMSNALPMGQAGQGLSNYQREQGVRLAAPSLEPPAQAAPTVADPSLLAATTGQGQGQRQANNYLTPQATTSRSPLLFWLILGLIAFVLFFVIGFFLGSLLIHP